MTATPTPRLLVRPVGPVLRLAQDLAARRAAAAYARRARRSGWPFF